MDNVTRILALREGSAVERCHGIKHVGSYSNGQHEHDAVMLLLVLNPNARRELIITVAGHDQAERWYGDMPSPVKWLLPDLARKLHELERAKLVELGVWHDLTDEEYEWLSAVDRVELWLWCNDQLALGNQNVLGPKQRLEESFLSHPLPWAAQELVSNYVWKRTPEA